MRIVDKTGHCFWEESVAEDNFDRPEIDRKQLRDLLIDSLEPDRIRWDHRLVSTQPAAKGSHSLFFENGTQVQANILVGADGAGSRIRPLLTSEEPFYSGVSFIETEILNPDSAFPVISAMVGKGVLWRFLTIKG
jgi:2-polyprenyl-6-methoxyphenol hydroxylase-like FAD-dependent oxidoreductase